MPPGSSAPVLHAEAPDGVLIAYRTHGELATGDGRTPVLLVHGFASDSVVTWEGTGWVRALRDAGHAVVTVDLRGDGASDKPTDGDAYAPDRLGADLVAVLDSAGVPVADVVGYSMGNRVVSALCELAPERVRRVVIGGAGPSELFATWSLDEARAYLVDDVPPSNPLIAVLEDAMRFYFEFHFDQGEGYLAHLHDPLAAAVVLDPDLVTCRPVAIDVELTGTLTRAMTIADWSNRWGKQPNALVGVDVDPQVFFGRFIARVGEFAKRLG